MKLVLQNLTKKFPNRNRKVKEDVVAVDNFTFEIPDGELIGLLCLNMDCQKFAEARDILESLITVEPLRKDEETEENFNINVKELVINNMSRVLPSNHGDLRKMGKHIKVSYF